MTFPVSTTGFATPGDIYNATPSRIVFGAGTADRIDAEVERLGARRALVLSTPGRGGLAQKVVAQLGERCVGLMAEAVSQVPIELARRGRDRARALEADCLVSVGGGASIGLGKAIGYEVAVPIVAVPTTYSGSEMTGFCGMTVDGVKRMFTRPSMIATTVVYDPALSLSLPLDVSAASAMNALAHCVDAVVVASCSPILALAAAEGARAIDDGIARVATDATDLQARSDALYGAYLGGAALAGGFALQHGVAHVLGGSFGIPHGLSHALVLPHVAAFYARTLPGRMDPIARAMGTDTARLGAHLFDRLGTLGLPTALAQVGFTAADIPRAVDIAVETDNGATPVAVTHEVVARIVEDAFAGRRP